MNVSGYMLEIKDIPEVRITGRVSKKKIETSKTKFYKLPAAVAPPIEDFF